MQSVTFVDGHYARHVCRAPRNVQDNLGRPVLVASLVGVDKLVLVHDGMVGFSREAREAGTHTPLCVVAAPCCEAPFAGPFSGVNQNMFLHLCCPLPQQLQHIV